MRLQGLTPIGETFHLTLDVGSLSPAISVCCVEHALGNYTRSCLYVTCDVREAVRLHSNYLEVLVRSSDLLYHHEEVACFFALQAVHALLLLQSVSLR